MLEALRKRYEADIAEAKATINIYLTNPVGIGEHHNTLMKLINSYLRYQKQKIN